MQNAKSWVRAALCLCALQLTAACSSFNIALPDFGINGSQPLQLSFAGPVSSPLPQPESASLILPPSDAAPVAKPEPIALPAVIVPGRKTQCVPFARELSGVNIRGNANKWWDKAAGLYTRSSAPSDGSVLVLRGYRTDRRGHVAVVKEIVSDRMIIVDHANWFNDGKLYLNSPVIDVSESNDWTQVRVWNTRTNQFGSRVYKVKGFILPADNRELPSVASLAS